MKFINDLIVSKSMIKRNISSFFLLFIRHSSIFLCLSICLTIFLSFSFWLSYVLTLRCFIKHTSSACRSQSPLLTSLTLPHTPLPTLRHRHLAFLLDLRKTRFSLRLRPVTHCLLEPLNFFSFVIGIVEKILHTLFKSLMLEILGNHFLCGHDCKRS